MAGFSGTDSFTYTATDGTADSNAATVTITVYSIPVANADSYTVIEGQHCISPPRACWPMIPTPTAHAHRDPGHASGHGTLTLNADGSFSYTPNAGFYGTDSFTYTATDGNATSAPATVTITVYSVPVANTDAIHIAGQNHVTPPGRAGQ